MTPEPILDFSLAPMLAEITPLLPHQGPIKDFIHQNTLQHFLDKPFHEAIGIGAELYGAQPYLPLSFYRNKFTNREIQWSNLNKAIDELHPHLDQVHADALRDALFNFVEIIDEKTFNLFCKQQGYDAKKVAHVLAKIRSNKPKIMPRDFLRSLLNQRLGCAIDHEVNAILFRLIGSYIDQGVILWPLLEESKDFRAAILRLVHNSLLPIASFVNNQDFRTYIEMPHEAGIECLLGQMFARDLYFDYLKESLLHHPGWSGMINIVNAHPESLAKQRFISIADMLLVKLALEWQFIKHKVRHFTPISLHERNQAYAREQSNLSIHDLSLAHWFLMGGHDELILGDFIPCLITIDGLKRIWHIALEQQYYESVLLKFSKNPAKLPVGKRDFQAVFCIDDRECSFRRHLEAESPKIETFGFPGFFGIEFYFKPHQKDLLDKMCPALVTPKYMVMEKPKDAQHTRHDKRITEFATFIARHGANSIFFGFVSAYTLGHLSALQLLFSFLHPFKLLSGRRRLKQEEKTSLIFERSCDGPEKNGLNLGFTREEMATRVFTALRNMGLCENFAPVVFLIAHGSSSVNNPHFAAYDCGACSGRPGGINARLFALMANIPEVREGVRLQGITIPDDTVFVGALHDTCTDEVKFFDLDTLSSDHLTKVKEFVRYLSSARANNAKERCKRFMLVSPNITPENALKEVRHRSRALFEPRPELNHATNALCIVGRRERSYGKNFDRRAFLQSYDPTRDASGQVLAAIMSAVIPVCGGINLEYFFSRIDPAIYGCGTKLSHNVCSLLGVGNGLDDDLRTGLPIQMTEIHDPVRLLIIIEQTPDVIEKAILTNPMLAPWVKNDWLKIASLNPHADQLSFYDHKRQVFFEVVPRSNPC